MNIEDVEIKIPDNMVQPIYAKYLVKSDFPGFLDRYHNLINEKDFQTVLKHHDENLQKDGLQRIKSIFPKIHNKQYTDKHLCEHILQFNIEKKDLEIHFKYHLFSFIKVYKILLNDILDIINDCNNRPFGNSIFEAKTKQLRKMLLDMMEILPLAEKHLGKKPESSLSMSRKLDGYEIFHFTNNYANGFLDFSNQAYYTTYAFLLRQSIETRVKNALGISGIIKNNKKIKITSDIFIDFLYENQNIKVPDVSKSILRKIFYWANYHIHGSVVLYYWQFYLVNDYLRPFFSDGKDGLNMHISGAISMKRKYYNESLSNDIKSFLEKRNIEVDNILMSQSPEALLI